MAEVDHEADVATAFFEAFDETWKLPVGESSIYMRMLSDTACNSMESERTLIVAFSSGAAHFDFESSLLALRELRRQHDRDGTSNLDGMLVSDSELAWFLRAPPGLSAGTIRVGRDAEDFDAYAPVVALVRRELEHVRPRRLYTVGYCRGGYAAVRAGVALGAQKVLAFSPQIYVDPAERAQLGLPATYFDEHLAGLRDAGAPLESLASVMAHRCDGGGDSLAIQIDIHVGSEDPGGVQEVAALKEALERCAASLKWPGLSVVAHEHAACGHEVPLLLKQAGTLMPLLEQFVL
jgi:dienelactone hydrolase